MPEWLSPDWFRPETLQSFTWENSVFLWGLAVVPLFFLLRWLFHFRFRQRLEIAFSTKNIQQDPLALLRFVPDIIFALFLALVLLALARPQRTDESVVKWTDGIDIMLVLDISRSMEIQDFKPNRLEAAKEVAIKFVEGRFQDRIGMVVFSGDAFPMAPLTGDYDLLKKLIQNIDFDMIDNPGTAIGDALLVATNHMSKSEAKSKVVILLSDGENTAGNVDPKVAAKLAYGYDIKLYTIGVGKDGKVPYGTDIFGRPVYHENTLNETSLREIATIGQGQYFRATDNAKLTEIFKIIDNYEKSEIKEERYKDTQDFYHIYLTWGILFFLIWLGLKSSFLSNALED